MEPKIELIPCILAPIKDCYLRCPNEGLIRKYIKNVPELKAEQRKEYYALTLEQRRERFNTVVDILSETIISEIACLHYRQIMLELYS